MNDRRILENKTCFITGATGGLGRHIAVAMAKQGCDLFLTSRSVTKLQELKQELEASGKRSIRVFFRAGDLTNIQDVYAIIKDAKEKFKSIDILINCAGVFPVGLLRDSSVEDFERCFSINVHAPFVFSQAFSQDMVKNKWGRIVNIGSSSAYNGFKETSIYCASKHALLGLSRSLHNELKEYNIRTFCISPGSIKTPMGEKVKDQDFDTFIDPKEIAEYVVFAICFDNEMVSEEVRLNRMVIQ